MRSQPDVASRNLYYWYYATLSMYQLQGDHWQRWNDALRTALVSHQMDMRGAMTA